MCKQGSKSYPFQNQRAWTQWAKERKITAVEQNSTQIKNTETRLSGKVTGNQQAFNSNRHRAFHLYFTKFCLIKVSSDRVLPHPVLTRNKLVVSLSLQWVENLNAHEKQEKNYPSSKKCPLRSLKSTGKGKWTWLHLPAKHISKEQYLQNNYKS